MRWRKSSFSVGQGDCVELASDAGNVHVRNSQHPDRVALAFPASAVAALVAACQAGELDDLAG